MTRHTKACLSRQGGHCNCTGVKPKAPKITVQQSGAAMTEMARLSAFVAAYDDWHMWMMSLDPERASYEELHELDKREQAMHDARTALL